MKVCTWKTVWTKLFCTKNCEQAHGQLEKLETDSFPQTFCSFCKMTPILLLLIGLARMVWILLKACRKWRAKFVQQSVAQNLTKEMCTNYMWSRLALFEEVDCSCNQYNALVKIVDSCLTKCGIGRDESNVSPAKQCCRKKCLMIDQSIIIDGKINTTALSRFYGPVGDPKVIDNIVECEEIGKNRVSKIHFASNFNF